MLIMYMFYHQIWWVGFFCQKSC